MNFQQVLNKYREECFSERDKGSRFETLMKYYLKTDPMYSNEFSEIWLWSEFPFKSQFGGKDIGIDLVAKELEGGYTAIQCKCYRETARIDKPEVDTFLSTSGKSFEDEEGEMCAFTHRLWISTTNKWTDVAEDTLKNQNPPVNRISLTMLEEAPVDWLEIDKGIYGEKARTSKKTPRPHQKTALEKCHEYFADNDRGKLIMACGTGKTYTSLKIAEQETNNNGLILFLVPSIALLGQTLSEWVSQSEKDIYPICICSDPTSTKQRVKNDDNGDDFSVVDLARPASTNVENIKQQFRYIQATKKEGMTVVFSTYQSIDVIAKAQKAIQLTDSEDCIFDMIICDEAHRTTGVILNGGQDETAFTKVHDNEIIKAKKRLYMTATPRLYHETAKDKAKENNAILCSMDDKSIYGEEIYRIGFGEAVEKNLLSDYKVLVLTLSENDIPQTLQNAVANPNLEITTDDATKLVGCINALSKRVVTELNIDGSVKNELTDIDAGFMHKAVAFCRTIKESKQITSVLKIHRDEYYDSLSQEERKLVVSVDAEHVDGSMGASARDEKLSWLKSTPTDGDECRILTNVRCLSEGVDVPSLDAILFLSAKNSQVDVVQSVGRVMRKAEGKKYGYIIIPVIIPADTKPEEALDNNDRFKVVWTVLNALRAHDDRFNAIVNKIELNKKKTEKVLVAKIGNSSDDGDSTEYTGKVDDGERTLTQQMINQLKIQFGELQDTVYAKMVQKVGSRKYWEQWAKDIADIAQRHVNRITNIVADDKYKKAFEEFMDGLHANINPYITQEEAIEMLAQHIITRPVFEALFENYSFIGNNSVSIAMQKILDILDENAIDKENETLEKFYADVRQRCEGIDNAEGKQKIIIELYDKFFKTALPKVVEKLGIVYTPVEVVDFIINSVADVLKKEFNRDLSDKNVHILDPFTGTGTFITRLLQSGRIKKEDLKRKYEEELHANEIVLLAYYIASINIENTYHDLIKAKEGEYQNFEGICLTDTFQLNEDEGKLKYSEFFPKNVKRVQKQKETPITIIMGNPPYSVGQKSANDNAQNQKYENLDRRVAQTYVANTTATNKNSLYDSYIKAFRWASDRLDKTGGIIGFITNGIWLDNTSMDGFRKCIEEEFSSIYVFNLRGGIRGKSKDMAKREGQNVFDIMTGVAITLLVKNPNDKKEKATIYYRDIGDYLSRKEKLDIITKYSSVINSKFKMDILTPNEHYDWINKRSNLFGTFPAIGDKNDKQNHTYFEPIYANGLKTNCDSWCYNFSLDELTNSINLYLKTYNKEVERWKLSSKDTLFEEFVEKDPKLISWHSGIIPKAQKGIKGIFEKSHCRNALYRPFQIVNVYYDGLVNQRLSQMPKIFPNDNYENLIICVSSDTRNTFTTLISNKIADLSFVPSCQCFPLYWYEEKAEEAKEKQMSLLAPTEESSDDKYIKHDGVTNFIHNLAKEKYSHKVTKEDIFYYVYGILHSEDYRTKFAADLKKMLPRIPLVDKTEDFWAFSNAGRDLAKLHLKYEDQAPLSSVKVIGEEFGNFKVDKIKFKNKDNKSEIIFNNNIKITNIPNEAHEYLVNGKSPIECIMERYQVSVDSKSGIKNDPNDWAIEHDNPRYILDLLLSVISLSVATVKIIKSLPKLTFEE